MAVAPSKPLDRIQFYQDRTTAVTGPWVVNAAAIGTTSGAVTALASKVAAARAAYNQQQDAQAAARAATLNYQELVAAMTTAGADVLKQIKARAATDGANVYVLAEIPAPATPSPKPAPGKPSDFVVTLDGNGALNLKWKCANPPGSAGTIYQVYRRLGATGEFAYIGGTGTKAFEDASVPAGSTSITYQVQAVRSTAVGPWAQFNVNFGVSGPGGAMSASVVETAPSVPKMAA